MKTLDTEAEIHIATNHAFAIPKLHPFSLAAMTTQQLTAEALSLPLSERVLLAQTLWQSIDDDGSDSDESNVILEVIHRDKELDSGAVRGRTHEEVILAAKQAIQCA